MADEGLVDFILMGKDTWNTMRPAGPHSRPDLRGADFTGRDLSGFNLHDADLQNACLRCVSLQGANLDGANLREADLAGADLSGINTGLRAHQFSGADLTGASLPDSLSKAIYDLDAVKDISESAQKLFMAMLAACLYCWLTIGTTSDLNLITNRATSALPVIQTSIPIVGFYFIAPLLLLLTYFYFHFYLQKLWEELASLPAIFPDGRPLNAKSDPWLLNDLVRSHITKLKGCRPFISYAQQWISTLLAWWVVPITLVLFWARYLRRHDLYGTVFQCILIAAAIIGAILSYRLACRTLFGIQRTQFTLRNALMRPRSYVASSIGAAFVLLLIVLSLGIINGTRSRAWDNTWWKTTHGPRTLMPHALRSLGYSPFADLRGKEISAKPADWDTKPNPDYKSVAGAQLSGVDLREADLTSAFLANAVLNHANLQNANLLSADLTHAQLIDTHLEGADLLGANLKEIQARGAHLAGADLTLAKLTGATLISADLSRALLKGADLSNADLTYANLRNAQLDSGQLQGIPTAKLAYMDDSLLGPLGLPATNNADIAKREAGEHSGPQTGFESDELARLDSLSGLPGGDTVAEGLRGDIVKFRNPVITLTPADAKSSKSYTVPELMRLYNFPELDGEGQTIGIIELGGGYKKSDLAAYFKKFNLPEPDITWKSVDNGKNITTSANSADGEVQINIEVAATVAPKAKFILYFTANTSQGYIDALKAAIDDRPNVLMSGWGSPEPSWTSETVQALNNQLHRAADAGITFVAGAGDSGPTDGITDGKPHVDFPASSPWALTVGGTLLQTEGASIRSEVAWNDLATSGGATGTGVSKVFQFPDWQRNTSAQNSGRNVPDVAINASPSSGYQAVIDGQTTVIGGTSSAAPLWAGLIALLNQGLGKNLGFFNPLLYKTIGSTDAFNPIPRGEGFHTQSGWNPLTGWGTPDGKKLLAALRAAQ